MKDPVIALFSVFFTLVCLMIAFNEGKTRVTVEAPSHSFPIGY